MRLIRPSSKEFEKLCQRRFCTKKRVKSRVEKILEDVYKFGDKAVVYYTRKFDGVKLEAKDLKVTESDISLAFNEIETQFVRNLKEIIQRITKYYKSQLKDLNFKYRTPDESVIEERKIPLDSVGIYVPAGTAPLVSTVYMSCIPAIVAGVKRIVLASPPDKKGRINPYILVVASLLKINEVYKIGGAQAIGALACGTQTVKPVDKIIGPGNQYVTEAKRQVYGLVDVDMLAGPSELVVVAQDSSNFDYVLADLKSQEEHFGGLVVLVTNSEKLSKFVKYKIPGGYIIKVKNMQKAQEVVNKIAPEHLEIMVDSPYKFLKDIRNASAIFMGNYSPTAVGDYIAGPSHVLPTLGTAKFLSGLGLDTFFKSSHIINFSRKELEKTRSLVEMVAKLEGLEHHLESILIRFK